MPSHSAEALIDVAYILYDAGFSNELRSAAPAGPTTRKKALRAVLDFLDALCSRRMAGVEPAIRKFELLRRRSGPLGRHGQSIELELAYLRELRGNYPRARREFRALNGQIEPFDSTDRTQLRIRLYYADILIMDGGFREASRLLRETYELIGSREIVNWGELIRHRAHAYRFSFLLEDAAEQYLLALQKTHEAPGMIAKLHTNLVETYCWYDPDLALAKATIAIELNQGSGNEIELAKCHAATGIAYAMQRKFGDAKGAITEARKLARATSYPAAAAFALQAEAIAKGVAKDTRGQATTIGRLRRKTAELGTYGHLSVAPLLLAGDDRAFGKASSAVEWFEPVTLEERLRRYLGLPDSTRDVDNRLAPR